MTIHRKTALAIVGLVAVAIAFRAWSGRLPPQLPASDEVYKAVDALFTAVTAHDEKRLAACEARLETFKTSGQLAPAVAEHLRGVIARARAGQWESAARQLYDFIQGQRREVSAAQAPPAQSASKERRIR